MSAEAHDLIEVGKALEASVKETLAALEESGIPAREADEFIRDCVFNAWWDWDYGVLATGKDER